MARYSEHDTSKIYEAAQTLARHGSSSAIEALMKLARDEGKPGQERQQHPLRLNAVEKGSLEEQRFVARQQFFDGGVALPIQRWKYDNQQPQQCTAEHCLSHSKAKSPQ